MQLFFTICAHAQCTSQVKLSRATFPKWYFIRWGNRATPSGCRHPCLDTDLFRFWGRTFPLEIRCRFYPRKRREKQKNFGRSCQILSGAALPQRHNFEGLVPSTLNLFDKSWYWCHFTTQCDLHLFPDVGCAESTRNISLGTKCLKQLRTQGKPKSSYFIKQTVHCTQTSAQWG